MQCTATQLHRFRARLLFIIILGLLAAPLFAQDLPLDPMTAGRHYVIANPDTTSNRLDSRYPNNKFKDGWFLFLYSAVGDNRVKLTGSSSANLTLQAGKFQVQEIKSNPVVTRINSIESNTVTIESEYPIVVYCFCAQRQGMEAWTPIPVDLWGTNYTVAAVPGEVIGQIGLADETAIPFDRGAAPSEVLVIAAYDNTRVTITPGRSQKLIDSRAPVNVTLKAGQCYQVQSVVDTNVEFGGRQVDLGGMSVTADKPIGVLSGNTRALVRQDQQGLVMNAYKNMLMEWLPSSEQLGTEFVFMPSWDSHRPGIESPSERLEEYARIYGASSGSTPIPFYRTRPGDTTHVQDNVRGDSLREFEGKAQALYFKSESPVQGMMHSASVLQLVSKTPCFRGIPCQTFNAWAPYMVEMTPREQWPSFAPFYAPVGPASPMQHFINVVTDTLSMHNIVDETGNAFPFTRRIPGTDLIWGSTPVTPGVDHYLMGRDGARFGGFVYGFYAGGEQYRPGRARKGSGAGIASGDGVGVLHPCEYEEYNALSYGYPLAPRRALLRTSDSLTIDSARSCADLTLTLHLAGGNSSGFRGVTLDPGSQNTTIRFVNPMKWSDVVGMNDAIVTVTSIDAARPASGTVRVEDRAGHVTLVPYSSSGSSLGLAGGAKSIDFGKRFYNAVTDTTIVYTNTTGRDITVNQVRLDNFVSAGSVIATVPSGPAERPARPVVIKPGESFSVVFRLQPISGLPWSSNELVITTDCIELRTPLDGTMTSTPALLTYDIDFGVVRRGDPTIFRDLKICNIGGGAVRFSAALADSVIAWGNGQFSISKAGLDSLRWTVLGAGQCVTVSVGFTPLVEGLATTTARLTATTRSIRDSSIWRAIVSPGAGVDADEHAGYALTGLTPNPTGGAVAVGYTLGRPGRAVVAVYDPSGALVATLADEMQGAGEHRAAWDASGAAAGIYYCRITSGGWSAVRPIVVVR